MGTTEQGTSYTQGEHEVDAAEPVEPTEPGFYRYSGGAQAMIFSRGHTGGWFVHHDNGLTERCEWGYIAQALGVWGLVRIGSEDDVAGIDLNARAYGWEVGRGNATIGDSVVAGHPDNPFVPGHLLIIPSTDEPTGRTPRERFEGRFGPITDDQWQWLKEFVRDQHLDDGRDTAHDLLFVRSGSRGVHTVASAGFPRYQPRPTLSALGVRTPSGVTRDLYELDPSERAVLATWCRRIVSVLEDLDS